MTVWPKIHPSLALSPTYYRSAEVGCERVPTSSLLIHYRKAPPADHGPAQSANMLITTLAWWCDLVFVIRFRPPTYESFFWTAPTF